MYRNVRPWTLAALRAYAEEHLVALTLQRSFLPVALPEIPGLAITGLVDEVLTRYHPGIIATLCPVLLDPASGDMQIVNCGHMPLLLVDDGGAAYLGEGGLLLGLPMHEPHIEKAFLPEGGTMLLMTDGLVEERGGSQVADSR
jgi:hypothetical protein